jgi:hypothetical protein
MSAEYMRKLIALLEEEHVGVDPVTGLPWDLPDTGNGSGPREPDIEIDPGRRNQRDTTPSKSDEVDWSNPCTEYNPKTGQLKREPPVNTLAVILRKWRPMAAGNNRAHTNDFNMPWYSVEQIAEKNEDILTDEESAVLVQSWYRVYFGLGVGNDTISRRKSFQFLLANLMSHVTTGYCMMPSYQKALANALTKLYDAPDRNRRIGVPGPPPEGIPTMWPPLTSEWYDDDDLERYR